MNNNNYELPHRIQRRRLNFFNNNENNGNTQMLSVNNIRQRTNPNTFNHQFPFNLLKGNNAITPTSTPKGTPTSTPVKNTENPMKLRFIQDLNTREEIIKSLEYKEFLKMSSLTNIDRANIHRGLKSIYNINQNINSNSINNSLYTHVERNNNNNSGGSSGLLYTATHKGVPVVIKFLNDSEISNLEINTTEYLSNNSEVTPKFIKRGEIEINNKRYLYFITEKYDGNLTNLKKDYRLNYYVQKNGLDFKISRQELKSRIESLYSEFTKIINGRDLLKHGDIQQTNILFRIDETGSLDLRLIDFNTTIIDGTGSERGDKFASLINRI